MLAYISRPDWFTLAFAVSILAIALGSAEFLANALRANGALLSALLPRDIIWRIGVIGAVSVVGLTDGQLDAAEAALVASLVLLVIIVPQAVGITRLVMQGPRDALSHGQLSEFWLVSFGLWGTTTLAQLLSHVVTLIVMAILGPEIAGIFFAAQRTATLISVALSGLNQVVAPQLSHAIHSGDTERVRWLTGTTALVGAVGAIVSLLLFIFMGRHLLTIFDPSYGTDIALMVLLIMSLGQVVNAAAGPSAWLLQMGGRQYAFLRILLVSNLVGLPLLAALTYFSGPIGAAIAVAITSALWNMLAVVEGQRALGINSSIIALFKRSPPSKDRE